MNQELKEYYACEGWIEFRNEVLQEFPFCAVCGQTSNHVHHKTYKHLFFETFDDVEALCEDCHAQKHGKDKYIYE